MIKRTGKQWLSSRHGNVAMIAALCAVPLAVIVAGVLESQDVMGSRADLQAAVDAGALAGAQRLSVANVNGSSDVQAAAVTAANANLPSGYHGTTPLFTVTQDTTANSVTMTAAATHIPLLGLMDFGNTALHATATADALGAVPLCILQTGTGPNAGMDLNNDAQIHAPNCGVQANGDITVASSALIQAERTQAAGTITGPVSPAGFPGSLSISDPFASLNLSPPTSCLSQPPNVQMVVGTTLTLQPGVHCGILIMGAGATLQLMPGEHWFMGNLVGQSNAVITGDDVVMLFGPSIAASFLDNAQVRLTARKSGPYAGFLIATTRNNTQPFTITSNNVSELLGTVYIPNATLVVDTTGSVAQNSAWSIVVARSIQMRHNPNLVINTDYAGSGVPVPGGVGPSQKVSLVK
jgi:Flp pilus assembly protein TadG